MIKKLLSSQLRINMLSGVVATVVNVVVLAIAYPVYLHFLGYEKYGVWLVLAVVLTFAQLGDLGISSAVIKLVAEGWRKRRYISVFRNKMTDAMQEASETQCWLEFACACRYITDDVFQNLDAEYEGIIGMLSSMEMKSEKFCYVEREGGKGRR